MPVSALEALQSSAGTWFQSGKAYEVEANEYRNAARASSLVQNGDVAGISKGEGDGIRGEEAEEDASSSSSLGGGVSLLLVAGVATALAYLFI